MQHTDATTTTSRRVRSELVAPSREARDVVVLRGVLLDVEVGLRDVRLGLVVVVVGDEVLDRVLGEELPELVAELRRERLVVRDHERRALELLHHPGHRRRLAGAGRAEERLAAVPVAQRLGELCDRLRLVAGRAVGGGDAEIGHAVERSNGQNACSAALSTQPGRVLYLTPPFAETSVSRSLGGRCGTVSSPAQVARHGDEAATRTGAGRGDRVVERRPRRPRLGGNARRPSADARPPPGSDPHVPRHRRPARVGAVPRPVCPASRAPGADAMAADAGYEAVTLGRVFDAWHGRATLPPRPVVLSFDDGYRSHVTAALPILAARGWPGVLNLDLSNLAPSWGVGVSGVRRLIRRRMGDRRALAVPSRSVLPQRRRPRPRGERLTAGDPAPVRSRPALLLLPGRTVRRRSGRGGRGRGVRGSDHHGARSRPAGDSVHPRPCPRQPRRRGRRTGTEACSPRSTRRTSAEVASPLLLRETPIRAS